MQERRDRHARRLDISAERVLEEIAACAFSNMQDFWPVPGERLDLSKTDRRLTAAVSTLKIKETLLVGKESAPQLIERVTEIKLYNKVLAIEKLGDHLGLFEARDRDSLEERIRRMTPEQRVARMEQILELAPQRYGHLIENSNEAVDNENL